MPRLAQPSPTFAFAAAIYNACLAATIWSMTCSTPHSSLVGATSLAWGAMTSPALAIT